MTQARPVDSLAVEARELSKAYRIYRRPHHRILEWLGPKRRRYADEVLALRGVDLRVARGSTLGVIGENGAGKSTLLQLIVGTLRPTSGQIAVNGRISAILDLGAGFHPEFTGRENVFLAGAIQGFSPEEMQAHLAGIEDFAEIGEFFDRPVRTYSSGMFVRLAFSVATSMDPDILVIDEVLAVGDQYFQKKCIDRIDGFRKGGRTILFCSHNMYQVRSICDQVLWLKDGAPAGLGNSATVLDAYGTYLRERERAREDEVPLSADAPSHWPRITELQLGNQVPGSATVIRTGQTLNLTVAWQVPCPPTRAQLAVSIRRNDGLYCFGTATHVDEVSLPERSAEVTLQVPSFPFLGGEYDVYVFLLDETGLHLYDRRVTQFAVRNNLPAVGLVHLPHEWSVGRELTSVG